MSETIITDGIVLRESATGERDRIITVLTEKAGVIRAFANGAKGVRNKISSSTDLLCFSRFTFSRSSSNVFTVREASVKEIFFPIRQDLIKLSLSQYIGEIADELSPREDEAGEQLRLVLNALSLISNEKRELKLIKAATELRLLTLSGYMPSVVACAECGKYEDEKMLFDTRNGKLFCFDCAGDEKGRMTVISLGVLAAIRFICFSEPNKIFNFTLPAEQLRLLGSVSERYLTYITGRRYKTLDFYNEMTN